MWGKVMKNKDKTLNRLKSGILISAILVIMLLGGISYSFTVAALKAEKEQIEIGFSQMVNWTKGGTENEIYVCDLYFSRNVLTSSDGNGVGYMMHDGEGENDYTYLQDYIAFNGKIMSQINEDTDTEEYDFLTFPSTLYSEKNGSFLYRVPVVIYAPSPEHLQIRIHEQYYVDEGWTNAPKIQILKGFYADGEVNDAEGNYRSVKYSATKNTTFTYGTDNNWACDNGYEAYEEPIEIIERADIDFDAIDYEQIFVSSISQIVEYSSAITVGGELRKPQYLCVYFDKAISYQFIPYITLGKKKLTSFAANPAGTGVELTQAQIDSIFDYRIDESFNYKVKINGKTIQECKKSEIASGDQKVYVALSGETSAPNNFTLYILADSASWMNPEEKHTLEIEQGFRTPLFGEIKKTQKFYYNPETLTWSETDYSEIKPERPPANEGCGAVSATTTYGGVFALVGLLGIVMLCKKKGGRYE